MALDLDKFLHIATQPAVTDKFVAIAEQLPAQANQDHAHTIQDDPSTHEDGDKCPYSLSDIFVS
jgi:hypothetical protein